MAEHRRRVIDQCNDMIEVHGKGMWSAYEGLATRYRRALHRCRDTLLAVVDAYVEEVNERQRENDEHFELEAQAAALREALEECSDLISKVAPNSSVWMDGLAFKVDAVLSTDAGREMQERLAKAERKVNKAAALCVGVHLDHQADRAAMEKARDLLVEGTECSCVYDCPHDVNEIVDVCPRCEALAALEERLDQ